MHANARESIFVPWVTPSGKEWTKKGPKFIEIVTKIQRRVSVNFEPHRVRARLQLQCAGRSLEALSRREPSPLSTPDCSRATPVKCRRTCIISVLSTWRCDSEYAIVFDPSRSVRAVLRRRCAPNESPRCVQALDDTISKLVAHETRKHHRSMRGLCDTASQGQ